jgi:hypothetical protein
VPSIGSGQPGLAVDSGALDGNACSVAATTVPTESENDGCVVPTAVGEAQATSTSTAAIAIKLNHCFFIIKVSSENKE